MPEILIIGACGPLGRGLAAALRIKHGVEAVLAADSQAVLDVPSSDGPYVQLNALDKIELRALILREKIRVIYQLSSISVSAAEKQPLSAWEINTQILLHVLEVAKSDRLRVFWPSSPAVFGPNVGAFAPQHTVTEPVTVCGISERAGELWCRYYHEQYGVDVRSIRFPGLICPAMQSGNGTTDYVAQCILSAIRFRQFTCPLKPHTLLPMIYLPDAVRAVTELMAARTEQLTIRTAYNINALSFSPQQLQEAIVKELPAFSMTYRPDHRQESADTWPAAVNDQCARKDWGWQPAYDLSEIVRDMLKQTGKQVRL